MTKVPTRQTEHAFLACSLHQARGLVAPVLPELQGVYTVQVTSSAKRRRQPGSTTLAQTPDGSFRDLMQNAADLLQQCGFSHVPAVRVSMLTARACSDHLCWSSMPGACSGLGAVEV